MHGSNVHCLNEENECWSWVIFLIWSNQNGGASPPCLSRDSVQAFAMVRFISSSPSSYICFIMDIILSLGSASLSTALKSNDYIVFDIETNIIHCTSRNKRHLNFTCRIAFKRILDAGQVENLRPVMYGSCFYHTLWQIMMLIIFQSWYSSYVIKTTQSKRTHLLILWSRIFGPKTAHFNLFWSHYKNLLAIKTNDLSVSRVILFTKLYFKAIIPIVFNWHAIFHETTCLLDHENNKKNIHS